MEKPQYVVIIGTEGSELAREMLIPRGRARTFSSGKTGWNASGKAILANPDDTAGGVSTVDRHQLSINFVRIGGA
jgi:hypothetical protein